MFWVDERTKFRTKSVLGVKNGRVRIEAFRANVLHYLGMPQGPTGFPKVSGPLPVPWH